MFTPYRNSFYYIILSASTAILMLKNVLSMSGRRKTNGSAKVMKVAEWMGRLKWKWAGHLIGGWWMNREDN